MSFLTGSSNTTTQHQTGTASNQSNSNLSGTNSGQSTVTPNENPIFKMFRESILPAISQQYADAQKPVYGDQQVAQVVNNGNNVTNAAKQSANASAARRGALNGGGINDTSNALDAANASNTTSFMNQIPLLNEQEKMNRTQNLLGLATSFLGQSPIGSTTTGNSSSNQTGQSNSFGTSVQDGTTTQKNNPSLLSSIGSLAGLATSFIPGFGAIGSMLGGSAGIPGFNNNIATTQQGGYN